MAEPSDDEILGDLYPEKKLSPEYEKRKLGSMAKAVSAENPEETYARAAGEAAEGVKRGATDLFAKAGEMKEQYFPSKETSQKNIEEANTKLVGKDAISEDDLTFIDLKKQPVEMKEGGKKAYGEAVELWSSQRKSGPIEFVSGLSETKLQLEAAKYGITPQDFARYKAKGNLNEVKMLVDQGKARELTRLQAEAYRKKTEAETSAVRGQAAQRFAKAEQVEAQVPQGGNRLVKFGWKEGSFGARGSEIYINAEGSHGQIRQRYLPGKASGVTNTLANSRLEIAKMKSRVLNGATRSSNIVQLMQPNHTGFGVPTTISKLAGNIRGGQVSKLVPNNQPSLGPSILSKLSPFRRRP